MARRVFFSFHYQQDIWRANVVRNSWVAQPNRELAGFFDASLWEETKRRGDDAIRRMIDSGLNNTTVTAVLIGSQTAERPWVQYEIQESVRRGNGLLGIRIHGIADRNRMTSLAGENPFGWLKFTETGQSLADVYSVYDWVQNSGFNNLGSWIERAAQQADR